jgi:Protein of unknown function (DUF2971)
MAELKIYAKPSSLYRYRTLGENAEREVRAIKDGYIYCPAYSAMNDPMEGLHRLSSRFAENPRSAKSRTNIQEALEIMGIASMSEVNDHEPMWAHYADQFKGMCVQYSLNRLLRGLDASIAITRMMYSEIGPVLLDDRSNAVDRARLCLSSKTVRWAGEREWRLFRDNQGEARYKDMRTVTKIFLGSRVSMANEKLVRDTADTLDVSVVKMEIDAYSITFKSPPRKKRLRRGST